MQNGKVVRSHKWVSNHNQSLSIINVMIKEIRKNIQIDDDISSHIILSL